MPKFIKKNKLVYKDGYIRKKNKIVGIPLAVAFQLTKLERAFQEWCYLNNQPKYSPGPSLDGFKSKSIFDDNMPYIEAPDTPVTDRRIEEAMQFMAEIDSVNQTNEINQVIDEYQELIRWCQSKEFIEGPYTGVIDIPCLGNPLELTDSSIVGCIRVIMENPIAMCEV